MGLSAQAAMAAKVLFTHITDEKTEAGRVGFSAEDHTPGPLQCQKCTVLVLPLALRDRLPGRACHQTLWAHLW